MSHKLVLISGGARSGKSRLALALGFDCGPKRRFIATATASDAEMTERIEKHRRERGAHWSTLQVGVDLPAAIDGSHAFDVVVVDCLTLFLSTLLLGCLDSREASEQSDTLDTATTERMHAACERATGELRLAIERCPAPVIVVSNEVGMGLVPDYPLGRVFRDVVGRANQELASHADAVYLTALGVALRLKPAPLIALPVPTLSPDCPP